MDTVRALRRQHEPKPPMRDVRWEEIARRAEAALKREGPVS